MKKKAIKLSSMCTVVIMKYCFIIFLLVFKQLRTQAQDGPDVVYDDLSESASISDSDDDEYSLTIEHRNPCAFRGTFLFSGQAIRLDPCTECTCKNGTTTCLIETCQTDPRCTNAETTVDPSECCPHCPYTTESNATRDCSFRGTMNPHKHRFHLDPCTICICEDHGKTHCHITSCADDHTCEPSQIVVVPEECCPQCPYKLVVTDVHISHDHEFTIDESSTNQIRFSLHVAVDSQMSFKTVRGEQMWRLGAWISTNQDGSGTRTFLQTNIFNEQDMAKSYHRRNPENFKWSGLEYTIQRRNESCGSYFCVEFDRGEDPKPFYNLGFTFQPLHDERERLVDCLALSACNDNEEDTDSVSFSFSSYSASASLTIEHRNPCSFRGQFLSHGETIRLDPCTECTCKNGTTTCLIESCQTDPRCTNAETIIDPSECCPHCPYNKESNATRDCFFRGTINPHKHRFHLDPCTICICEDHGKTHCYIRSCPANSGCAPSQIVVVPEKCCPQCPYKLVVTDVHISHDHEFTIDDGSTNQLRFSLHVGVDSQMSSKTVRGEQMWRLGAWISTNKDGSGTRTLLQTNIFNEQDMAKSYHRRNPENFKWSGLEYTIQPGNESCGSYFCVEFDRGGDPRPLYNLGYTFQPLHDERGKLIDCLAFSACNDLVPQLQPELLTSKRIFERHVGDAIIFECNATNAHFIWWEHSSWAKTERVSSHSTFRVDHITLEDQGSYYCVAYGHGKYVSSAEQVLIIPDIAQFILRFSSMLTSKGMVVYQTYIVNQLEKANFTASHVNPATTYVSKEVQSRQGLNDIKEEIWYILQQTRNSSTVIGISNATVRLEGLSLCFDDSVDTEVGTLNFPSVNVNSEVFSNEMCTVSNDFPRATRRCDGDMTLAAEWKDVHVRNCFKSPTEEETRRLVDSFFQIMHKRVVTANNVSFVSRDLVDITTATTTGIDDIEKIASVLEQISSTQSTLPIVVSNMLQTVDNIVTTIKITSNEDIVLPSSTSSRILKSIESQLESIQINGKNLSFSLSNIEVNVVQILDFNEPISFTVCTYINNLNQSTTTHHLNLTPENQIRGCRNGATIHIPPFVMNHSYSDVVTGHNQKVFPVTFTSYQNGVLFNDEKSKKFNKSLDSIVISASTSHKVENLPSGSLITTTFVPLSADNYDRSCVFWNYTLYGEFGGWSSKGCHFKDGSDMFSFICECDHLTNFALLMYDDVTVDTNNTFIVVGCIIAIISLLVVTCTYLAIRNLRIGMSHQITINQFIAFLGLYSCFLLGTGRTGSNLACAIFAGLIHYFCLSAVAWMNVEATSIYFSGPDFVTQPSGYVVVIVMAIAWGLPLIVVGLSAAAATESYAHGYYCLPAFSSVVFCIFLLGIVSLLLTYNLVIYFLIACKIRSANRNTLNSTDGKRRWRRLQNSVLIFVFWSLSWLFGFLAVGNVAPVYGTLFCLFSLLLGVCLLLQYCLRQEAVIYAWERLLRQRERIDSAQWELH